MLWIWLRPIYGKLIFERKKYISDFFRVCVCGDGGGVESENLKKNLKNQKFQNSPNINIDPKNTQKHSFWWFYRWRIINHFVLGLAATERN